MDMRNTDKGYNRKEGREAKRTRLGIEEARDTSYYTKQREIKPLRAITDNQQKYIHSIDTNTITLISGPAGTGKTYIAAAKAAELLIEGKISQIILTRPGIEAGEKFGFLPGELEEKYEPYIRPFMDALVERLGHSQVEYYRKKGVIKASPLAFMRGTNFNDCLAILDEAQNTTPTQMELFLTRVGKNCKVIVDGDIRQKDLPGISGLQDAMNRLDPIPSIGVVRFGLEDCVRSGIVKDILYAYYGVDRRRK